MKKWEPITETQFEMLLLEQLEEMDTDERHEYTKYEIKPWKSTLRRSDEYGDEHVFVVAQKDKTVLYFDDVEWGFNLSVIDDEGRILSPGGSQMSLADAFRQWFIEG